MSFVCEHAKIVTNLLFDFEAKLFRNDYKIYEKRKYKIRQILFKAKLKKKKIQIIPTVTSVYFLQITSGPHT